MSVRFQHHHVEITDGLRGDNIWHTFNLMSCQDMAQAEYGPIAWCLHRLPILDWPSPMLITWPWTIHGQDIHQILLPIHGPSMSITGSLLPRTLRYRGNLTIHLHLAPELILCGAIPPLACVGTTFSLRYCQIPAQSHNYHDANHEAWLLVFMSGPWVCDRL